jgi:nucleoside-diphosphate-sugar epimerase
MKATVFGPKGFVGSHLSAHLESEGWAVRRVARGDESWRGEALGHVFFCVGLTADFRERPLDAIDAHVGAAVTVLRHGRFESFLYLSTTRLYSGAAEAVETARITVDPSDPSDLYNLSKLAGEAACLALARPTVRIARLSNVFGPGMGRQNFLGSIVAAAVHGRLSLGQAPESSKDYVAVEDVVAALARIAVAGEARLYNVASGADVTHGELLGELVRLTGCDAAVEAGAPTVRFPTIRTARLHELLDWRPVSVLERLPRLIASNSEDMASLSP